MNKEFEFKNFEEYIAENDGIDLDKLIRETFTEVDEGFLSNIGSLGFFKSLKLSLGKGILGIMDMIKKNPKMQKDIQEFIGNFGNEAAKDLGDIVGKFTSRLQQENEDLKRRLSSIQKTPYTTED